MSRAHNDLPKDLLNRLTTYRRVLATSFAPDHELVSRGKAVTPATLVARIDAFFALCKAVKDAEIARMNALVRRTREAPGAGVLAEECKAVIRSAVSPGHPVVDRSSCADPAEGDDIPVETHVKAAAARRETRKQRKTMGKRQRAKLKA